MGKLIFGGFIGSHLCEKLMAETPHKVLALDVYSDKIKHLLEPAGTQPWSDRIQFHHLNIKNDSRLEGLIKMSDLVSSTPFSTHYHFRFSQFLHSFFETVLEFLSLNTKLPNWSDLSELELKIVCPFDFLFTANPNGSEV